MPGDTVDVRYPPRGPVPACIYICDGVIETIRPFESATDESVFDAGDSHVLPGLVDTHVHINEPGRTEWEGFYTATRSAAAGQTSRFREDLS